MSRKLAKQRVSRLRLSPRPRLLFTLFFLLTFSIQSYVTATHIHNPNAPDLGFSLSALTGNAAASAAVTAKNSDHNRVPAHDAQDDCPFCNAVAHAGAFLFPSLLILVLPADGVVIAGSVSLAPVATIPVSHSWESRGPPQA